MQNAKEKMSNMASAVKENTNIYRAKAEEKMEKAVARTEEEKKIAEEQRKAKEAQAKMELHQAKAQHAAEKFEPRHDHDHRRPAAADGTPLSSTTLPTYPLGGHRPGHNYRPTGYYC